MISVNVVRDESFTHLVLALIAKSKFEDSESCVRANEITGDKLTLSLLQHRALLLLWQKNVIKKPQDLNLMRPKKKRGKLLHTFS